MVRRPGERLVRFLPGDTDGIAEASDQRQNHGAVCPKPARCLEELRQTGQRPARGFSGRATGASTDVSRFHAVKLASAWHLDGCLPRGLCRRMPSAACDVGSRFPSLCWAGYAPDRRMKVTLRLN